MATKRRRSWWSRTLIRSRMFWTSTSQRRSAWNSLMIFLNKLSVCTSWNLCLSRGQWRGWPLTSKRSCLTSVRVWIKDRKAREAACRILAHSASHVATFNSSQTLKFPSHASARGRGDHALRLKALTSSSQRIWLKRLRSWLTRASSWSSSLP